MAWTIKYPKSVRKVVEKLDPQTRRWIRGYLENRVAALDDPRELAKPLKGGLSQLWRYRVGDFRVIYELHDDTLVVLVIRIGHRRDVYS